MMPLGTLSMPNNSAGLTHGQRLCEMQEGRGDWFIMRDLATWSVGQGASQASPSATYPLQPHM